MKKELYIMRFESVPVTTTGSFFVSLFKTLKQIVDQRPLRCNVIIEDAELLQYMKNNPDVINQVVVIGEYEVASFKLRKVIEWKQPELHMLMEKMKEEMGAEQAAKLKAKLQ